MSIDHELAAVRAVARQMRSATRSPDPRRLSAWARALDSSTRSIEAALQVLRQPAQGAAAPSTASSPAVDTPGALPPRQGAPQTSVKAWRYVLPKTGTQRRRVLQAIAEVARDPRVVGLTDVEIQHRTGLSPNSERPRRHELVEGGWIEQGERTRTHYGTEHTVWVLTSKGAQSSELWAPAASA